MHVKFLAFTSERRRFLGRSLATSGGRTTCLRRTKGIGLGFYRTRETKEMEIGKIRKLGFCIYLYS